MQLIIVITLDNLTRSLDKSEILHPICESDISTELMAEWLEQASQ